jgi:glycosyltransferase involved in cell wall biosynthesis
MAVPEPSLRILLATDDFSASDEPDGGSLRRIAAHLPADRLTVSAPWIPGVGRMDRKASYEIRRVPVPSVLPAAWRKSVWRKQLMGFAAESSPGMVVADGVSPAGVLALWLKRRAGIEYLLHLGTSRMNALVKRTASGDGAKGAWAEVLREAEGVLVPTEECRFQAYKLGVAPHAIHVVADGVDTERFRPELPSSELRQTLGMGEGGIVLSAAWDPWTQDEESVLRAFAEVKSRRPDTKLVVLANGEQGIWKKLAKRLRLGRSVCVVPPVAAAKRPAYYSVASVFLQVLRDSGEVGRYSTPDEACLEAMSCGLPVVGGCAAGTLDAVGETMPDQLFRSESHAEMGDAIVGLLDSEEARRACGQAGRDRVQNCLSAEHTGREVLRILEVTHFRRLGKAPVPRGLGAAAEATA